MLYLELSVAASGCDVVGAGGDCCEHHGAQAEEVGQQGDHQPHGQGVGCIRKELGHQTC